MKWSPLSYILAVSVLLPAGCIHYRDSFFASVEGEVRKIATRHRYTLVGVKHAAKNANADVTQGNLQSQQFSNDNLKRFQPDVFADGGIGFMVREARLPDADNPYEWTMCYSIPTLGVLPLLASRGFGFRISVDVLDNPDARAAFELQCRFDYSYSLCTPLPILFCMGDASPPDGMGKCSATTRHEIVYCAEKDSKVVADDAIAIRAYAIAAALKKMEDDGLIDGSRGMSAGKGAAPAILGDDKFEVVEFRKDGDYAHRYAFALRRRGGGNITLRESRSLQKMLRSMVREDYLASFPDAAAGSLVVEFVEFSLRGNEIAGRAAALSLAVDSLRYDPHSRVGTMRLRIGESQFEEARRYARKNIESLVRDKNVALGARAIPSAATFYLQDEKLKGDILEIVFKTE